MNDFGIPPGPATLRPREVGEILGDALALYRRHWTTLLPIVAVVAVPLSVVDSYARHALGGTTQLVQGPGGQVHLQTSAGFAGALAATAVFGVISVLITQILTGAIGRAAAGLFVGRDLELEDAYRFGLARLWSILLVGILVALAVTAGFLLLVIPGFIVLTRLAAAVPSLVVEDARGRSALSRSWRLVAGRSWPVFGAILTAALLGGIVAGLIALPFGTAGWVVSGIASGVGQTITTPFTVLVSVLIYLDLRVRRENLDAARLAADLGRSAA